MSHLSLLLFSMLFFDAFTIEYVYCFFEEAEIPLQKPDIHDNPEIKNRFNFLSMINSIYQLVKDMLHQNL